MPISILVIIPFEKQLRDCCELGLADRFHVIDDVDVGVGEGSLAIDEDIPDAVLKG